MKKNNKPLWTSKCSFTIFSALFLAAIPIFATEPNEVTQIEKLKNDNLKLKAALSAKERELEIVKADFFNALDKLKKLRQEVVEIRLEAANMLVNKEALRDRGATRLLLKDMHDLLSAQAKVHTELLELSHYVDAVLDSSGEAKDSVARKAVKTKINSMRNQLEKSGLLSLTKKNDSKKSKKTEGRILAVNEQLRVVILNIGHHQGIIVGSSWQIDGKSEKLVVVESRPEISAAKIVNGNIKNLVPGMMVKQFVPQKETLEK